MARELRTWLALAAVVLALVFGLSVRAGLPASELSAETPASASPDSSPLPSAEPVARADPPLTGTISPPTRPAAPSPTEAPSASPATPAPMASAPPPPSAPAPHPAAPTTPAPEPVHDDEPVLLTEQRTDGGFGQTLTIDGYSVHAVRTAAPSPHPCLENGADDVEVFAVTLTYSGPIFDVHFAIKRPTESWCIDASGSASQMFPSGVTRQVVVRYSDGYMAADAPLVVWVTTVNGPHTLTFAFH